MAFRRAGSPLLESRGENFPATDKFVLGRGDSSRRPGSTAASTTARSTKPGRARPHHTPEAHPLYCGLPIALGQLNTEKDCGDGLKYGLIRRQPIKAAVILGMRRMRLADRPAHHAVGGIGAVPSDAPRRPSACPAPATYGVR